MMLDAEGKQRQPIIMLWQREYSHDWIVITWRYCVMAYQVEYASSTNLQTVRDLCSAGF